MDAYSLHAKGSSSPWFGRLQGLAVSILTLGIIISCDSPTHTYTYIARRATVSTYAGVAGQEASSAAAVTMGAASIARFYFPSQPAVDSSGNLYLGDAGSEIYQITTGGQVSVYAGTATATLTPGSPTNGARLSADFDSPQGVAVDKAGNIYIADNGNQVIRKIGTNGKISTLAGSGQPGFSDGQGAAAQFYFLCSLAVDGSGNVYVADLYNHAIRKVTPGGYVSTLAGSGGGGKPGTAVLGYANGPGATALFHYPLEVAADDSGNVYVVDENNVVRMITPSGFVSTLAGPSPAATAGGGAPLGYQDGAADQAQFDGVTGITVDHSGTVYVVDAGEQVIRKISGGLVSTIAGTAGVTGFLDGWGGAATFTNAENIAADRDGNLYLVEGNGTTAGNAIRKITFSSALQ